MKTNKTKTAYKRKQRGGMRKTRKNPSKTSKSLKSTYTNTSKAHIVRVFLEILNMVKLYHWKTHSYSEHKATDELYANLNEHVDKFVEVLLGKDPKRIKMLEKRINLIDPSNVKDFKTRIYEYREFLTDMNLYFNDKSDMDLLAIRDDLLIDINQFLYLMTLHK